MSLLSPPWDRSGRRGRAGLGPAGAQHRVVEIAASVVHDVVESIELTAAPRGLDIDRGDQDLLLVHTRRSRQQPSLRTGDEAASDERLTALDADAIGADDHQTVAVRTGHRQR